MRLKHLWCLLVVALAAACAPIAASSPTASTISPAPAAPPLVISNVRLFDGEDVLPSTTVVVQGGLITAVGNGAATPAGAEVIDGAGKTLLPGLIDAHTHVFEEAELRQALIFGVTTELDMGMDYKVAAELRQEQAATGAVDRADLFSAGTVATAPGGHGTQFGLDLRTLTSPQEAEAFVAEQVAEGSDFVKIILEDGSAWGTSLPSLDQATVAALVQAAHDQGLLALTHIQTLAAATQALAAGSDGLAHIMVDATPDEVFVENAVAGNLFVVATLAIFQGLGEPVDTSVLEDPHLGPYLTPADVQSLRSPYTELTDLSLANGKAAVRQLFAAGVPILAGTDAPQPGTTHGASLHRELVLLTESGLSPLEALRAATSVTADIFALNDRGRIAPGLRADLLLVNGDPTTEITATRDIVGVWKLGVAADRESYLAELEAQRAAAAEQQAAFAAQPVAQISDFEAESLATGFGAGWSGFTDQLVGGASTAELTVVEDGAAGSDHSLLVTGEVTDALPFAWSGVMFSPGAQPFAPLDLSSKPLLHFWARGEGGPYRVQLNCTGVGQVLPEQPLPLTAEWQEFTIDLSTFAGCDLTQVRAVIFSTGPAPSPFSFHLDEATLQR
jgi:imidazolonepropionase-like amidohydrolase